jgi:hypothetical protein
MGGLITDDVLNAFAVAGDPQQIAAAVLRRFGDIINRVSLYLPYRVDPAAVTAITAALRTGDPDSQAHPVR